MDGKGGNLALTIFNASNGKLSASNGCFLAHISYKRTPKDHISP